MYKTGEDVFISIAGIIGVFIACSLMRIVVFTTSPVYASAIHASWESKIPIERLEIIHGQGCINEKPANAVLTSTTFTECTDSVGSSLGIYEVTWTETSWRQSRYLIVSGSYQEKPHYAEVTASKLASNERVAIRDRWYIEYSISFSEEETGKTYTYRTRDPNLWKFALGESYVLDVNKLGMVISFRPEG